MFAFTMQPLESQLHESIHRIARRWWMFRGLEITGAAVVIGSLIGLILTPFFAWHGQSSWQLCAGVLTLATGCGAIAGFRRFPSPALAAREADRQWKLDDLLSSAVGVSSVAGREGIDPSMRLTLLQMALQELTSRRVEDLVFHRVRLRAWAGFGSLPLLLVLLTVICSQPAVLKAAAEAKRELASSIPGAAGSSPRAVRAGEQDSVRSGDRAFAENDRPLNSARDSRTAETTLPTGDSAGRTRGVTDDAQVPRARAAIAAMDSLAAGEHSGSNGSSSSDRQGNAAAGRVNEQRPAIPPWERTLWQQQQSAAIESLRQNPPPAEYRDLIRDYFSR